MKKEALEAKISKEVSKKTGLDIREDCVHVSKKRFYYTQELKPGYAYLLHHYRGPFFVEINCEDWSKLEAEKISVEEFINSSQWLYGFYWGGGSMISGGYYTQLEKEPGIHDVALIKKVMRIVERKGWQVSSGYQLTEEEKADWNSVYNQYLHDARVDYFNKVDELFYSRYGYHLRGMSCSSNVKNDELQFFNNSSSRTFELFLSEENIWNLLIGNEIPQPEDMKIFVGKAFTNKTIEVKNPENFMNTLFILEITRDWEEQEAIRASFSTKHSPAEDTDEASIIQRFLSFFKN